ncbi:MAG: ribonuclease H [Gemmatimonadales bacterium]
MSRPDPNVAIVHADESCLGNGREGRNPGGAASLVERWVQDSIVRQDLYISSPDTTNNRMALAGAIATFATLGAEGGPHAVLYVSDSQYLVKGMNEWVPDWRARGWRRKAGRIENLELWQTLVRTAEPFQITWRWVRGHADHPKNEYVNDLAIHAAETQATSAAMVPSRFDEWLEDRESRGKFCDYNPDIDLADFSAELARLE